MKRERLIHLLENSALAQYDQTELHEMAERLQAGEDIDPPAPLTWITTMPVLSTAHLDEVTMNWLIRKSKDPNYMPQVVSTHDGWMMYVPSDGNVPEGLPLALYDLLRYVQGFKQLGGQRYNWVRFDPDGDEIEGLPTFGEVV